jgi:DNA-binding beta-propeller fold protein YncE
MRGVAFTPDDKLLIRADLDGTVSILDAATGRPVGEFSAPRRLCGMALSPDGTVLVTVAERQEGKPQDSDLITVWTLADLPTVPALATETRR